MIEFDWLIHYRCNYKCYYCFFSEHWDYVEKKNVRMPYTKWVEAWKRIHDKYGDIKIIITGGEPAIFPNFQELLVELNKFAEISFDTNLSYSREKLEQLVSSLDCSKLFIGASFHPIFADLDDFVKKIEILQKYNVNCRVHYVTHPNQLRQMPKVKETFLSKNVRFTPIPFRGIFNGKRYPESFTKEEEEIIYGVTKDIAEIDKKWADVQVEQTDSKGKLCRAGQLYARVDCDGTVYPCGNDFKETGGDYLIGNILKEDFSMRTEPIVCKHTKCPCEFRWIVNENVRF
ncbi:MAG: radical SAM protein [Endomicrobiaceae bacterium]|jgi:sulfatase maturation enzyme AslB (radical SAM superfamily)|nr:radical SAM protein [Endomicrobiaceae bacterium]